MSEQLQTQDRSIPPIFPPFITATPDPHPAGLARRRLARPRFQGFINEVERSGYRVGAGLSPPATCAIPSLGRRCDLFVQVARNRTRRGCRPTRIALRYGLIDAGLAQSDCGHFEVPVATVGKHGEPCLYGARGATPRDEHHAGGFAGAGLRFRSSTGVVTCGRPPSRRPRAPMKNSSSCSSATAHMRPQRAWALSCGTFIAVAETSSSASVNHSTAQIATQIRSSPAKRIGSVRIRAAYPGR